MWGLKTVRLTLQFWFKACIWTLMLPKMCFTLGVKRIQTHTSNLEGGERCFLEPFRVFSFGLCSFSQFFTICEWRSQCLFHLYTLKQLREWVERNLCFRLPFICPHLFKLNYPLNSGANITLHTTTPNRKTAILSYLSKDRNEHFGTGGKMFHLWGTHNLD